MSETRRSHFTESGFVVILDRDLPVPVGTQIRGQIEYGIAIGEIPGGARLPSVRDLATNLGVAPVTISHVYKELQTQGLIQSRQGQGTFVPDRPSPHEADGIADLHRSVDELFARAQELGFSRTHVAEAVAFRARQGPESEVGLSLLFVGIYADATDAYVDSIRTRLRRDDTIHGITFDHFEAHAPQAAADVYITLANRKVALRELVGPGAPIISTTFIPTRDTRTRLAGLEPSTRLAVVAGLPSFLQTLQRNVKRFAPHVADSRATTLASEDLAATLAWCDMVVYATGTEEVREHLRAGVDAFEFRYEPESRSIERILLPTLESVRRRRTRLETA